VVKKPTRRADPAKSGELSLHALCRRLGRDTFQVKSLQKALDLPVPEAGEGYSVAYLKFLQKIVALRVFSVPVDRIAELFDLEKKILRLLHIDSIGEGPIWYLDGCRAGDRATPQAGVGRRLLLTGYDLGFPLTAAAVQHHLDFGQKDPELFRGVEMGEDVLRMLARYMELLRWVRERVEQERPLVEDALRWQEVVFDGRVK
jgi:hypothetical protein